MNAETQAPGQAEEKFESGGKEPPRRGLKARKGEGAGRRLGAGLLAKAFQEACLEFQPFTFHLIAMKLRFTLNFKKLFVVPAAASVEFQQDAFLFQQGPQKERHGQFSRQAASFGLFLLEAALPAPDLVEIFEIQRPHLVQFGENPFLFAEHPRKCRLIPGGGETPLPAE